MGWSVGPNHDTTSSERDDQLVSITVLYCYRDGKLVSATLHYDKLVFILGEVGRLVLITRICSERNGKMVSITVL